MQLLASLTRAFVQALQRLLSGLRWLARQVYRQRTLGVASNPQLTSLLDVHFVAVAAHLALLAALAVVSPAARDWLLSLPLLALLTGVAIWRPTPVVIRLLLAGQLVIAVVAAVLAPGGILLTMLFAMAMAQQVAVIRSASGRLGRATAAGLLLGVFTFGVGLIVGLLSASVPLWILALLMGLALILSFRIAPPPPRPPRPSQLPKQAGRQKNVPEGYSIYRPSSLDDSHDPPPR